MLLQRVQGHTKQGLVKRNFEHENHSQSTRKFTYLIIIPWTILNKAHGVFKLHFSIYGGYDPAKPKAKTSFQARAIVHHKGKVVMI